MFALTCHHDCMHILLPDAPVRSIINSQPYTNSRAYSGWNVNNLYRYLSRIIITSSSTRVRRDALREDALDLHKAPPEELVLREHAFGCARRHRLAGRGRAEPLCVEEFQSSAQGSAAIVTRCVRQRWCGR